MRHLLLVTTMFLFGLAVTLATASVLQDVAITQSKSAQTDEFEVNQIPKPVMMPLRQSRPSAIDMFMSTHPKPL
jgi:hypothetical protein